MPGSVAETVYGRQGGGWLPKTATPTTINGDPYGTPEHCATCGQDRTCVAIAADPKRPQSGRWHVCARCQEQGQRYRVGLIYTPIVREQVAS